ncbi:MAG: beta-lactamase family protein [Acidimicrobiales bacterium]|nr:beta-lactamase family protein [Acidimicrobiales bacterium]
MAADDSNRDAYEVTDPVTLGLVPERLDALIDRARREIDEGLLPSCQLAVARQGRLALFETLGDAAHSSRYTIFSCTKGLVAGAIWILLRSGDLSLDVRVAELVPEFGTNGKEVITVEQLLTHTAGFPTAPMSATVAASREGRLAQFAKWRLNWEPGSRFEYHPTSAHWVLGELIERVTGEDFRAFIVDQVARRHGLTRFGLGVGPGEQDDINDLCLVGQHPTREAIEAVLGFPLDLAELMGEVTDEALLSFNQPEVRAVGFPGGGGVATAADLALYYQSVLHDPFDIWSPERLSWATQVRCDLPDPLRGVPAHRSLGLVVAGHPPDAQLRGFGYGLSPRSFGHDGAGGQIAWCDPVSGVSFAYLTNGRDLDILREARRTIGLSSRAAVVADPTSG